MDDYYLPYSSTNRSLGSYSYTHIAIVKKNVSSYLIACCSCSVALLYDITYHLSCCIDLTDSCSGKCIS